MKIQYAIQPECHGGHRVVMETPLVTFLRSAKTDDDSCYTVEIPCIVIHAISFRNVSEQNRVLRGETGCI